MLSFKPGYRSPQLSCLPVSLKIKVDELRSNVRIEKKKVLMSEKIRREKRDKKPEEAQKNRQRSHRKVLKKN